jgi:hypothetical protein
MALKSTVNLGDALDLQGARARNANIKDYVDEVQGFFNNSTGHTHLGTGDGEPPQIPAGGLATDAVETAKIKDANVTLAKMAASSVDATKTTEDVLRKATKTVTTAQILALNTTPIELVAAPGATKFIDIVAIHAKLVYVAATYSGSNALEFRYTNGSGAKVAADISSTFINTASGTAVSTARGQEAEIVNVLNAPVMVFIPTANPTVGDSDIIFTIYYRIITP